MRIYRWRSLALLLVSLLLGIAIGTAIAIATQPKGAVLWPCATEDSTGCYWDASERGNGLGHDFVSPEGE